MNRRWRGDSYRAGRSWPARGHRWAVGRVIAAECMVSAGVLALVAAAACSGIGAVLADRASTDRTSRALTALSSLRGQLDDAQRGERGFVLTADEHALQPYTVAAAQVPQTLAELRRLIGADAAGQRMLDDLQASADATVDSLGEAVTLLRTEGFRDVQPVALGTIGDDSLARAGQLLDALRQDQVTALQARQRHAQDQTTVAVEMIAAAMAAGAVLIALKSWWISRSVTRPPESVTAAEDRLPADPGTAVADATAHAGDAWHVPLRVLLAEDNQVNQKVAQFLLDKLGHRVDTVANGLEAVHALRSAEYDVVLMDVQMPVLDGLEATRLIRSEFPADRQPHIIAMTASVLAEDRVACRAAGMNDYLSKPLRLPDLTSALTLLLDVSADSPAGNQATGDAASAATITTEEARIGREADIRARLADISDGEPSGSERDLLARLLTSFTAHTPAGIDQLAELITAGDLAGVRNQAHTLTGSAANIGVTRLAHLLAATEADARTGRLPSSPAAMTAIRAEYAATAPVCESVASELTAGARH